MFELIEKTLFAGIGAAYLAREKVEELGRKITEQTDLSEAEGKRFIEELKTKSADARLAMEKMVNENMEKAIKRLNIPTREEVSDLEKRLERLEREADESDNS
ncbi:MAG: hypothetical protein GF350_16550 [Chitinivibrionales bacterium]|nr:hypothetical protein [Chitinivibrionales bacterium]